MNFTDKSGTQRTFTKDGYLVVPATLSKVGVFDYLATELGEQGSGVKKVARTEQSLFTDATIASFEGMPITLGHPTEDVTAKNWKQLAVGSVRNVKRDGDMLAGEAWIYDENAIKQIQEKGIEELSCGYSCDVLPSQLQDADFEMSPMIGNHIAIVAKGRCGNSVKIADEGIKMGKNRRFLDQLLGAFGIKLTDDQAKKVDETEQPEDGEKPAEGEKTQTEKTTPSGEKTPEDKEQETDKDKEKPSVKDEALAKELVELRAENQRLKDTAVRAAVLAEAKAVNSNLTFADSDTVRQIQEKVILDSGMMNVDTLKTFNDDQVKGVYESAKAVMQKLNDKALGATILKDSQSINTGINFNDAYNAKGGK